MRYSFAIALATTLLSAAPVPAPDGAYSNRSWRVEDGLPHSRVQALSQTTDGYLWIGTAGGLVRFDGLSFVVFDRSNTPAFADDSVLSLLAADSGVLWIGTEGGGLVRYSAKVFTAYGTQSGLSNLFVRSILQDRAGRLWVGTDRGVFQKQGERFVRLDGTADIPWVNGSHLREDGAGHIWVYGNGIYRVEGGALRPQNAGAAPRVIAALEQPDGTLWLASGNGLFAMRGDRLTHLQANIALPLRLLRDASGNTWIGATNGLFQARNGKIAPFQAPEALPNQSILALFQDRERNIWVGTADGLVRLHQSGVTTLAASEGMEDDSASAISRDRQDRMWVVSAGKLYRLMDHKTVRQPVEGLPSEARISTLFEDSKGCYWIGTSNLGFFRWRCGPLLNYSQSNGLRHNGIRAFLEDREGQLWVATGSGLARLKDGQIRVYYTDDGLAYGSVRSLLEAPDGEIWVGTDGGLNRIRNGNFVKDRVTAALGSERIWALCRDVGGTIWIGTQGAGLFSVQGGEVVKFGSSAGMPKTVHQILDDAAGNLWISGPRGVLKVARKDLARARGAKAERIPLVWFGTAEGMRSEQMSGGAQPAGAISLDGEIWFPSVRGAVAIPAGAVANSETPAALIDDILVDGRSVPIGRQIRIPAGTHTLEIQYTATDLLSPRRVALSYKLENFDKDWTNASSRRAAFYTQLPPGDYQFRVIAQHRALPSQPSEATVNFRWEPHPYQTGWFAALVLALLASALCLGFWLYARQTRQRYALLLSERTRLAREMHDTVIQGCVGVSTLLEAASSFERTDPMMLLDMVNRARRQVKVTLEDARQAVWDLRHRTAGGQLLCSLPEFARQLSEETGVPIEVAISGEAVSLDPEVDRNLFAAAREAVRNAIAHGQPKQVRILLNYERDQIHMEVIDDGVGFGPDDMRQAAGHYGILGMRERMEQMGGSLRLISQHSQGTRVVAELPIGRTRTVVVP